MRKHDNWVDNSPFRISHGCEVFQRVIKTLTFSLLVLCLNPIPVQCNIFIQVKARERFSIGHALMTVWLAVRNP